MSTSTFPGDISLLPSSDLLQQYELLSLEIASRKIAMKQIRCSEQEELEKVQGETQELQMDTKTANETRLEEESAEQPWQSDKVERITEIPKSVQRLIARMNASQNEEAVPGHAEMPAGEQTASSVLSGPRLPYEIIALIAHHLADQMVPTTSTEPLTTLADLNRASRSFHAITLPALYELTEYYDAEKFLRGIGREDPDGWKWTKYLITHATTTALLIQRNRLLFNDNDTFNYSADLRLHFPRIVFHCQLGNEYEVPATHLKDEEHSTTSYDMHLTLFKPIDLGSLRLLCLPCQEPDLLSTVCVFGVDLSSVGDAVETKRADVHNMASLRIAEGGGLFLAPGQDHLCKGQSILDPTHAFMLYLESATPNSGIESTFSIIMDFADTACQPPGALGNEGGQQKLKIRCHLAVFDALVTILDSKKRIFPPLHVILMDTVVTEDDVTSRLKALADILDRNWNYDWPRSGLPLVTIGSEMNLPSTIWEDQAVRRGPSTFVVVGIILGGQLRQEGVAARAGFTLQAWSELSFGLDAEPEPTDFFYEREYPCAHVPVPWDEVV